MTINRCVVDVGNTSVTSALFDGVEIVEPLRFATEKVVGLNDVVEIIEDVRSRTGKDFSELVVCVGVSRVRGLFEEYSQQNHLKVDFVTGLNSGGANILYETPETLGPDRVANTIAAAALHSQPTLIVDCGTAINIDFIDEKGNFVGGMIAPGLETSRDALTHFAPSLPVVEIEASSELIGTNTVSCIKSGIVNGAAAMIDSVVGQLRQTHPDLDVVLTGGYSDVIFPIIKSEAKRDEWLTLKGLGLAKFH